MGVATLCAIQKLFEKSFSDTLLKLTTIVNDGFRNRMQADTTYMDFSKAFDADNRGLLLLKLDKMVFKTCILIFDLLTQKYYFNSNELESVEFFHDLGILLDQRLSFRQHISVIVNNANGALGFMKDG